MSPFSWRFLDLRVNLCLINLPVCSFFVWLKEAVNTIPPNFTKLFTDIVICDLRISRIIIRVRHGTFSCKLCDFRSCISQTKWDTILEWFAGYFELIVPRKAEFISFRPHITRVLFGWCSSKYTWKCFAWDQHICRVTNIIITRKIQTPFKKRKI